MARRIFISFRFSDGEAYKNQLTDLFDASTEIINCSEDEDRSKMSEDTIQKYLYSKLRTTSVTIILIVNALLGCHDLALSCCHEIARISVMECSL